MPNILGRLRPKAGGWDVQIRPEALLWDGGIGVEADSFVGFPSDGEFTSEQVVIESTPFPVIQSRAIQKLHRGLHPVGDLPIDLVLGDRAGHLMGLT